MNYFAKLEPEGRRFNIMRVRSCKSLTAQENKWISAYESYVIHVGGVHTIADAEVKGCCSYKPAVDV